MKLFDEIERHDHQPAPYSEPEFKYLNRAARVSFGRIRRELEKWYSHYPASGQSELRARLRSEIDHQHQAAFFELFLHENLLRLGCQIKLHPTIPNISTTPDFLAEIPNGERFYIEATLATNESSAELAARARTNTVYDLLNKAISSSDFFLGLSIKGNPVTSPPIKKLASFLNSHLAELDPDEIAELYQAGKTDAIPSWRFEYGDWKIDFKPVPKKPEARNKTGVRPLGLFSYGFRQFDDETPLRNAITGKAGKYGDLDWPYVIAVNVLGFVDEIDIMEAMFGKNRSSTAFSQNKNTRVSAVLLATQLSVANIPRANLRLYHNPWAQRPYQSVLTQLPQATLKENHIEAIDGESNQKIFGLHESWPDVDG